MHIKVDYTYECVTSATYQEQIETIQIEPTSKEPMSLAPAIKELFARYNNATGIGADDALPETALFVDFSGSTYIFIDRMIIHLIDPKDDPRLCDGSGFIVHKAIAEGVDQHAKGCAVQTDALEAESDLLNFLNEMNSSEHPSIVVSIGNPKVTFIEETSNVKNTMKKFSEKACAPGSNNRHDVTLGTSIVGAFDAFEKSGFVERAKKSGKNMAPQRFRIFTDGQCTDSKADTACAFQRVLKTFPNAMFDIHAYVLNIRPENQTEHTLNNLAGLDVFQHINANPQFRRNISSFTVNYLLKNVAGRYVIAEPPDMLVLAVGDGSGASMTFTCFDAASVVIPEDNVKRNELVVNLVREIIAYPRELAQIKKPDMKDVIDNLVTLGKNMSETALTSSLSALVASWYVAMKPQERTPSALKALKKQVHAYLQVNVFSTRDTNMLNEYDGVQLRTQEQRTANFKTILNFWDGPRKNPVLHKNFVGTPIVLVDVQDVGRMACGVLTERFLAEHYNNDTLLFFDRYVPIPSNGLPDYLRMAIRRIISRVAHAKGVRFGPTAEKMAMQPQVVGWLARLSAMARSYGEGPLADALIEATTIMLQKEQIDNRSKPPRVLPSCHYRLQHDEGVPNEYATLPMLQPDPAKLLRYACGLSDKPPATFGSTLHEKPLQLAKITDMITYVDIDDREYYRYTGGDNGCIGDLYVSKETYTSILNKRSHVGAIYVKGDFVNVVRDESDDAQLIRWAQTPSTYPRPISLEASFSVN